MHPILGNFRQLVLYLLAWLPLSGILLYLLISFGGLEWTRALVFTVPLAMVFAFVCLSAWYSCRATPLASCGFWRLTATHLLGAVTASLLWVLIARGVSLAMASIPAFARFDQQIARELPVLFASGVLLYLLSVGLHYVLLATDSAHEAQKREVEARVLARDFELKALKTQVNPHFIFNSLNSISALTSSDPAKAREMCILLADFLRKTLGLGEKAYIPLAEELELVHAFLSVEKIRFERRLTLEETTDPGALRVLVPPLLLQPLIENAIAHGVANLTEGGWIRLEIRKSVSEDVSIMIENNFDPDTPRRRGQGIGLRNVRQRLDTTYGSRARFDVRASGDRFLVALGLPAKRMA
jgi:two-component system, LytTR family, sensor histidine kinase AlgZ